MASPLEGAWEQSAEDFNGLVIFTETHMSGILVANDRNEFQAPGKPTEAEEAEAYRTLRASSGPYKLSGSTMAIDLKYDRNPNIRSIEFEFNLDGDTLTIKHAISGFTMKYRKIG